MVKIYVRKILAGAMTLADVPERWKDAVAIALQSEAEDTV